MTVSDPGVRAVLWGLGSGSTDHDRGQAVGAAMEMREELERLRTLALDVDATLRTLKLAADRDARVNAKTIYQQLERARTRSRRLVGDRK
jgi:GTPase